jgi:hypothetical protein
MEGMLMTIRFYLTAVAFAWVLVGGLAMVHAQSDEEPSASQQLEGPDSSAGANDATSDENSSYLSGGGFDSAGDTGGAGDDGSNLEPHPFEATPNE